MQISASAAAQKVIRLQKPQPKQIEFCKSRAKYTCYGGARGGGKSWVARFKAIGICLFYAGIRVAFARKTLEDLKRNHLVPFLYMSEHELAGLMEWRAQERAFRFFNGSRIEFMFFNSDGDAARWQGQAFDVIFLEEATQFTEDQFNIIVQTNRRSDTIQPHVQFQSRMYFTCNPGGVGHAWVKRLFIDRDYRDGERAEDYVMIRALLTDNEYLMQHDPEYLAKLQALPEVTRRAMLYGDWDAYEGQFFPEFRKELHVCKPFEIPDGWERYRSFDYGFDMFAAYWIAVDYDGRAWVYREFAEGRDFGDGHPGLVISDAARKMTSFDDDRRIRQTFAPPDMWNRRQDSGRSAADIFRDNGVYCTMASNNREAGWADLREWLKPQADGMPRMQIFDCCTHLIRSMPLVLHDEHHVNDMSKEPHALTHFPDAIRYFVAGNPFTPPMPLPDEEQEELDRISNEWDTINDFY